MACQRIVTFLALLCAVASAVVVKDSPQDNNDHHDYNGLNNLNFPVHSEESRKFYKPYLHFPYFYHSHNPHLAPEKLETEEADPSEAPSTGDEPQIPEEAQPYNQKVTDSEVNKEENDENDGNISNKVNQTGEQGSKTTADEVHFDEEGSRMEFKKSYEVPCDFLSVPRYSCYTCFTYLVCKPEGGKIKSCKDPYEPYCNNGLCSATPSAECAQNSTALFY